MVSPCGSGACRCLAIQLMGWSGRAPSPPAVRLPKAAEPWSLTSLCEKLIKIGAKVVSHGRYVTFQLAEVAVSRQMFADILSLVARLRAPPAPA
jgi:hypothetical protein